MSNPTTGEWTLSGGGNCIRIGATWHDPIREGETKAIFDAHNAALAAAHQKSEQPRCDFVSHMKLEKQLAAERGNYSKITHKWEQCVIEIQQLREQLAAAVEALTFISEQAEEGTSLKSKADAALARIGYPLPDGRTK